MKFEKKIMRISELVKMGFDRSFLEKAVHMKDFPAVKGNSINSPYQIDTDEFQAWLNNRKKKSNGFI